MASTVDIIMGILVSCSTPLRLPIQAFKCIHILDGCDSTLHVSERLRNKSLSSFSQTSEHSFLSHQKVTMQM